MRFDSASLAALFGLGGNRAPRLRTGPGMSATGLDGDPVELDPFGAHLPYDGFIDDRFVVLSTTDPKRMDGLGFVIEAAPQTGVTDDMQKTLMSLMLSVTLPVGSVISMTLYASSAIEGLLELWKSSHAPGLEHLAPDAAEIARRSVENRAALMLRASRRQILPTAPVEVRHFRAWLSVVVKTDDPWGDEALRTAETAARAMEAVLAQAHLFGGLWTSSDFTATLRELLNPQKLRARTLAPKTASPLEELRWQLLDRDTEVEVGKYGMRFHGGGGEDADVTVMGLSLENYPPKINLALTSLLIGEPGRAGAQIPCPFLFSSIIEVPDSAAEKARVNAMVLRTRQMMTTPVAALVTHYHEAHREFSIAQRSFETAGGVARVLHQMVLFAPKGLETDALQAAQALARKVNADLQPNTCLHAVALTSVLPCGAGPRLAEDLKRLRRFARRTAATGVCGMPVMAEYRGTGPRPGARKRTPLLMLTGRKGQIMMIDPFANAHGSYSATVVGKPGSGKSVVMNELAASTLMTGGRVWVIDAGFSYQKLCALLGGAFFVFDESAHWDLNPFQFLTPAENGDEGDATPDRELLEMVVKVVVELMTPKGLPDYAESVLAQCILTAAAAGRARSAGSTGSSKGAHATMDDLRAALLAYRLPNGREERAALEMAAMLMPYVSGGPFGRWFDGSGAPVDFTNRFTVLELDGLSAHRRLRSAVLMTLMLTIERAMRAAPKEEAKLVCIDEAWDLMGEGTSGRFIETGYRRARKLNGAFVTATQSIADFFLSDTAQAAWRCADTRIFLRQDADGLDALARDGRMTGDAWLKDAIASLTTVAGAWSEMVVKVGDDPAAVGRLILDPYSRVAYSTLPAEVAAVKAWEAAGLPLPEAVARVAAGEAPPGG